jgi:uncharacterized iron-regulated protein
MIARLRSAGWLPLLLLVGASPLAGAQGREPLGLEIGDPARKGSTIALAVDQIHDTRAGKDVGPDDVATSLSDAAIVLVGESHTSVESHRVQARVIAALQRAGRRVILGLEMFPAEAPTAPFDRWLRGGMEEATLLRESGWYDYWGFPFGFYRDVFVLARQHRLPIRGVNAPRALISQIGRRGLSGIGAMDRARLPQTIDTTNEEHRQLFVAYVGGESATHGSGMPPETLQRMVDAQSTWDATMAFNAARLHKEANDPKAVVVVLVGSGHVAYGLGIARQARAYTDARVATVLPVATSPTAPVSVRASVADIVWGVPTETYPLYPTLGVSFRTAAEPATTVMLVSPGSPAEALGVKPGDVVTAIDDTPAKREADVRMALDRKQWGDPIRVVVTRGTETLTLEGRLRRR